MALYKIEAGQYVFYTGREGMKAFDRALKMYLEKQEQDIKDLNSIADDEQRDPRDEYDY